MRISELKKGEHITDFEVIKKLQLNILKEFDEFCTKHNLKYCITAGTLLGAVRHGGYIPWDDDIDVGMFRPDYEKLISLYDEMPDSCKIFSREINPNHSRLYGKICNTDYISVDSFYDEKSSGYLGIDVFPLEAVPENREEFLKLAKKTKVIRQLFIFANSALFKGNSFLKAYIIKPIPIIICKIIGADKLYKLFKKVATSRNFDDSKAIALLTGLYTENESFPKERYYDLIRLDFEGLKLPAVKDYDSYLSQIYGDYMKLPPVDKRQPHHSFSVYKLIK